MTVKAATILHEKVKSLSEQLGIISSDHANIYIDGKVLRKVVAAGI